MLIEYSGGKMIKVALNHSTAALFMLLIFLKNKER